MQNAESFGNVECGLRNNLCWQARRLEGWQAAKLESGQAGKLESSNGVGLASLLAC
jgi:hypothetical protein